MARATFLVKIIYTKQVKEQLLNIKKHIAKNNKQAAILHLKLMKEKFELLQDFPYLGKVNSTFSNSSIRDLVVLGYKVIYKINQNTIELLAVYKRVNLDESKLDV